MGSTPNSPSESHYVEGGGLPRWVSILFVCAFALVGYLLYASYTERQTLNKSQEDGQRKTQAMALELDKTNSRIADLKGQLDVTTQKLGLTEDELARARGLAQGVRSQQQKSDTQFKQQLGAYQTDTNTKFDQVNSQITGTQNDLNAAKADLEATKGAMQSMKGDLGVQSGLIARNHDEVEELKRIGLRDIFEFTLNKSSRGPDRVGPIQVQLKRVDPKRYKYTVDVVADDRTVEKRDRTAGEPVQFYVRGVRAPYEIVVFDVTKSQVKGYLSTPKTAAAAPPSTTATPPGQ